MGNFQLAESPSGACMDNPGNHEVSAGYCVYRSVEQCKLKTFQVFVLEQSVQEFLSVGYLAEAQGPSIPVHQNVVSQSGLQLGTLEQDFSHWPEYYWAGITFSQRVQRNIGH